TRPCWAQAVVPTRRICRTWGFLPRKAATAALMTRINSSLIPSASGRGGGAGAAGACFIPAAASSAATRSPTRATSWRTAPGASRASSRSAGSGFMAGSGSQRDQAVLLRRPLIALGLQVLQGPGQVLAGVGRLDDVVNEPAPRGDVGRGEGGAVLLDQF